MFEIVYPIVLIFQVSLPENILSKSTALILVFFNVVNNIVLLCTDS